MVLSHEEIVPGRRLLWLEAEGVPEAQPGQFFMLQCGEGYSHLLPRPFSLHRQAPGRLAFLYAVLGAGTRWLAERRPGERVGLYGPLGRGFTIAPGARRLLLVAGGMGVAPIMALAEVALKQGHRVTLVLAAVSASKLYPRELIPSGAEVVVVTDDGSAGEKGLATDVAARLAPGCGQLFACGPRGMYQALARLDLRPPGGVQVLLEEVMACGVGACFGCSVKTRSGMRLVCQDGPRFELKDVF